MKYLFDTHILFWMLFEPEKVNKRIREIFLDLNNEIFISLVNIWEISLKFSLKKLDLNGNSPDQLLKYILKSGIKIIDPNPLTFANFYKLKTSKNHKDPFDRMLIWQAICDDYVLISGDGDFSEYEKLGLKFIRN